MGRKKWFVMAVVLQIGVLVFMIGMKWSTLAFGTKIMLKTMPVDPWDMFRGDYITLNYEISSLDLSAIPSDKKEFRGNETVYVVLEKKGKYWNAQSVSQNRPKDSSRMSIKGAVRSWDGNRIFVSYGIESYFVPQHAGKRIEQERRSLDVEVSLDRWGNAALSRLFENGEEIKFE